MFLQRTVYFSTIHVAYLQTLFQSTIAHLGLVTGTKNDSCLVRRASQICAYLDVVFSLVGGRLRNRGHPQLLPRAVLTDASEGYHCALTYSLLSTAACFRRPYNSSVISPNHIVVSCTCGRPACKQTWRFGDVNGEGRPWPRSAARAKISENSKFDTLNIERLVILAP